MDLADIAAAPPQRSGPTSKAGKVWAFCLRHSPIIFLVLSLLIAILTIIACVLNFVNIVISPSMTLLNIYCMIFSLVAFSAELRQFGPLRKLVYHWMRYVYFLTSYGPRGAFYALFGLLLLGNSAILYVAGAFAIVTGIFMMLATVFVPLLTFADPQEAQRTQTDYQRYREHAASGSTFGFVSDLKAKLGGAPAGGKKAAPAMPYAAQGSAAGEYVAPPVATTDSRCVDPDDGDAPAPESRLGGSGSGDSGGAPPLPLRQDDDTTADAFSDGSGHRHPHRSRTEVEPAAAAQSEGAPVSTGESAIQRNFRAAMGDGYSSDEY